MADLVRIAESYFNKLLFDTPAREATTLITSEWSRRATLMGAGALTELETTADHVASYDFLVRVGGATNYCLKSPLMTT